MPGGDAAERYGRAASTPAWCRVSATRSRVTGTSSAIRFAPGWRPILPSIAGRATAPTAKAGKETGRRRTRPISQSRKAPSSARKGTAACAPCRCPRRCSTISAKPRAAATWSGLLPAGAAGHGKRPAGSNEKNGVCPHLALGALAGARTLERGRRGEEPGERRGLVVKAAQVRLLQPRQRLHVLLHELHLVVCRHQRDLHRRERSQQLEELRAVELVDLVRGAHDVGVDQHARARVTERRLLELLQEFLELRTAHPVDQIGPQIVALVGDGGAAHFKWLTPMDRA